MQGTAVTVERTGAGWAVWCWVEALRANKAQLAAVDKAKMLAVRLCHKVRVVQVTSEWCWMDSLGGELVSEVGRQGEQDQRRRAEKWRLVDKRRQVDTVRMDAVLLRTLVWDSTDGQHLEWSGKAAAAVVCNSARQAVAERMVSDAIAVADTQVVKDSVPCQQPDCHPSCRTAKRRAAADSAMAATRRWDRAGTGSASAAVMGWTSQALDSTVGRTRSYDYAALVDRRAALLTYQYSITKGC